MNILYIKKTNQIKMVSIKFISTRYVHDLCTDKMADQHNHFTCHLIIFYLCAGKYEVLSVLAVTDASPSAITGASVLLTTPPCEMSCTPSIAPETPEKSDTPEIEDTPDTLEKSVPPTLETPRSETPPQPPTLDIPPIPPRPP